ncbi:MAG: ATP synthase A1 subunit C [Methanoregula sp.]|jgi:V/A-type H+-transporting ATPase subunit C|uniref:ATP synthase A1 subunit C n=1 Tax=Methanoregula sp. TaxID=2052170 RepID=UPI003C1F987E
MDYGYVNARIRGMKSHLLDRPALENLIFQPDMESLIADLEKTPYRDDIISAKVQYSDVLCIEYALRKNFTRTFRKILKFVKDSEAERYIRIFLHRWDVQNITTILRGKNIHVTNEEILDCLVPAGELDEATLTELIKQPDVRAVIDMLATWEIVYARPLTEHYKEFADSGDLAILECALDRYYYENALETVRTRSYNNALIRDILGTEIDVVNIKTILRMIRDHVKEDVVLDFLIEGGKELNVKDLEHLVTLHTVNEAVRALEQTPYRFLADIPETVVMGKISVLEKQLEKYLIRKGVDAFFSDPLSVASVIGYFWAKYNEITNIRIISRCKTADFPLDQLKEELIYV